MYSELPVVRKKETQHFFLSCTGNLCNKTANEAEDQLLNCELLANTL